jgi:hypothetical protein
MRVSKRISPGAAGVSALAAALVLGLAACGSSENQAASTTAPKKTALKPRKVSNPAERGPSDMIAAVSSAKTGPVELKFELRSRPEVGQPVAIDIAILPRAPNLDRIKAGFQADDGLDIVAGAELPPVEVAAPAPDKAADATPPIRHTLQIVPKRDGIFIITAAVTADSANQPQPRSFSIPVIAGRGLPELAAKSEVAAGPAPNSGGTGAKAQ